MLHSGQHSCLTGWVQRLRSFFTRSFRLGLMCRTYSRVKPSDLKSPRLGKGVRNLEKRLECSIKACNGPDSLVRLQDVFFFCFASVWYLYLQSNYLNPLTAFLFGGSRWAAGRSVMNQTSVISIGTFSSSSSSTAFLWRANFSCKQVGHHNLNAGLDGSACRFRHADFLSHRVKYGKSAS